ncbi:MAG: hypothetical protein ABI547_11025 [Betaproteobacteria bacterium]
MASFAFGIFARARFQPRLQDVVFEHPEFGAHPGFRFLAGDLQLGFVLQFFHFLLRAALGFAVGPGLGRGACLRFDFHARFGDGERTRGFIGRRECFLACDFRGACERLRFGFEFIRALPGHARFRRRARFSFHFHARLDFRLGCSGGGRHRLRLRAGLFGGFGASFGLGPRNRLGFGACFRIGLRARARLAFELGAFLGLLERLFHCAHFRFEREAGARLGLGAGARFRFRAYAGFGFRSRAGLGVGFSLRLYIRFGFGGGARPGLGIGRGFRRHRRAHPRFGIGLCFTSGGGVGFDLRLRRVLLRGARLFFSLEFRDGFLPRIRLGDGPRARFNFLARLGFQRGSGGGVGAAFGLRFGFGALFGFVVELRDFDGGGEVEIELVAFIGGRAFREYPDVAFGNKFFDAAGDGLVGHPGLACQIASLTLAVNGKKNQADFARQADRLVLDLEHAFRGLRVDRLGMYGELHGHSAV